MEELERDPAVPTSEVGSKGPHEEEWPAGDTTAIRLLNLLSSLLAFHETTSTNASIAQLLKFNPDDANSDVDG